MIGACDCSMRRVALRERMRDATRIRIAMNNARRMRLHTSAMVSLIGLGSFTRAKLHVALIFLLNPRESRCRPV